MPCYYVLIFGAAPAASAPALVSVGVAVIGARKLQSFVTPARAAITVFPLPRLTIRPCRQNLLAIQLCVLFDT